MNIVRSEASRHLKKKAYMKTKIEELETNSKIKILGTCIGALVTLVRVTGPKLMQ
jgi:hypothetical protein